jgi:ribosomal protein S18 acetylase RimI-like enzyme
MFKVRPIEEADWQGVWHIIEPVFRAGETYPYPMDISEQEAHRNWVDTPTATYVVIDENEDVLGTYYIKPNQPGLGAHVCNCGYIVAENARGRGVASEMCKHSQAEAQAQGFTAMQYNLVVSTNEGAVQLWQSQGFEIVGTLTGAFKHARLGFVDAYVMYKELVP